jgi:glycosyltransferase involved in cell wall biosynthesis
MQPTVSVLIPAYNCATYIGNTLESVLGQTWPQLEVVVVDDGSEDATATEAGRFTPAGVRLIRQRNSGAAAARNTAFRNSTGTYIQFLDADDLIDPEKIALQVRRLDERSDCVACSEWGRFYDRPEAATFMPSGTWKDMKPVDWLAESRTDGLGMLFPALWLVPRKLAEAAGPWDETLTLGDDGEYFTRVLLHAREVLFCRGARCRYRSGLPHSLSGRKTQAAWASQFRVNELCEIHLLQAEDSERIRRGLALSWQHLAHAAYPYDPAIAEAALGRSSRLHDVRIAPSGGRAFEIIRRTFGWRMARRLQVAAGRR